MIRGAEAEDAMVVVVVCHEVRATTLATLAKRNMYVE